MDTKERIIAKFGGTNTVAEICDVTPGAVSQWELIPARHQSTLLNEARRRNISLRAEEFHPKVSAPAERRKAPS